MRCSICENENGGTVVCPRCGFDSRTDFIRLRTICPIPVQDKMTRLAAVQNYTQREYERRMYEEQRRNQARFEGQNGYAAAYAYKQSDDAYAENKVYRNAGAPISDAAPRQEAVNDNGERPFANDRVYDPERAQREREAWERDMRQRAEAERQRLAAEEAEKKRQQEQDAATDVQNNQNSSENKKSKVSVWTIFTIIFLADYVLMSIDGVENAELFIAPIIICAVCAYLRNKRLEKSSQKQNEDQK